jgi:lysine biosynthesis protein LysW
MVIGACPECDADVSFAEAPLLSQRIACPRCRAALVVIGLNPIELDWAFMEPLHDPYREGVDADFEHEWGKET